MSIFELKDGNQYGLIDMETGYDIGKKVIVPGTETYIREDNGKAIKGCLCKNIYDLEGISMVIVTIEPSVSSPASDFISHTNHEEIALVLEGNGLIEYPDGVSKEIKLDDCFYLQAGQPHRIVNNSENILKLCVIYSGHIRNVERTKYKKGGALDKMKGYQNKNLSEAVQKIAPGFTGNKGDEGHYTAIIFEGSNICFLYAVMCKDNSSPMEDFVSHPMVDELEFAISGQGLVIFPDRVFRLRPGIMRHNPPEQPSKSWNNHDEDLRLAVFYSTGKIADVYRTHKRARVFDVLN